MESNYGITLEKSSTISGTYATVGILLDVNIPEISTDKLNKTSHASGGKTEYTASGLVDMGDFDVVMKSSQSMLSGTYADLGAGTVSFYKITYPSGLSMNPWVFQGFPIKIKPGNADAQNPDIMKVTVTYSPTGGLTSGM